MSTDTSFDVSLDYNTLAIEVDALVDINSKCYELLGTICDASEAVGMLESGYLIINAFNTVNEIINNKITIKDMFNNNSFDISLDDINDIKMMLSE